MFGWSDWWWIGLLLPDRWWGGWIGGGSMFCSRIGGGVALDRFWVAKLVVVQCSGGYGL